MEERLQKVLARAGVAARRKAEELILAGRVSVNGRRVTELGTKVDERRDRIEVDGQRLVAEPFVYLVLNKPRAVMTTLSDPEGRPTVKHLLSGVRERVVPVGRLDFQTSGVLLLTNDGDFAEALMHPRKAATKVYVAKVAGVLDEAGIESWRQPIEVEGRATQPADVRLLRVEGDKTWLEITLKEGRNRQVRRLGEATGNLVMRLSRVAYAGITLDDLRPGQWRHLTLDELKALKQEFGVPRRLHAPTHSTRAGGRLVQKGGDLGDRLPERDGRGRGPAEGRRAPAHRGVSQEWRATGGRGAPEGRGPREPRHGGPEGSGARSGRGAPEGRGGTARWSSEPRAGGSRRGPTRSSGAEGRAVPGRGGAPPQRRGPSRPAPSSPERRAPAERRGRSPAPDRRAGSPPSGRPSEPRGRARPERPSTERRAAPERRSPARPERAARERGAPAAPAGPPRGRVEPSRGSTPAAPAASTSRPRASGSPPPTPATGWRGKRGRG